MYFDENNITMLYPHIGNGNNGLWNDQWGAIHAVASYYSVGNQSKLW